MKRLPRDWLATDSGWAPPTAQKTAGIGSGTHRGVHLGRADSKRQACGGASRDLEAQDDGPDEAQRQPVAAVHDVVGAHILQMHALLLEELQRLVRVLQAVDAHPAFGGLGLKRGYSETKSTCPLV